TYTGSLITQVKNEATGETTNLVYDGANLREIDTMKAGGAAAFIRTRYGYDAANRLASVTVDLTPEDGSIGDGKTFVTAYTYDGASKRVASIHSSDGSGIVFTYDAQ